MEIQIGDYVRFTNMPYIRLKLKDDMEGNLTYSSIYPFAEEGSEIAAVWLGNSVENMQVDVSSLL